MEQENKIIERSARLIAKRIENDIRDINFIDNIYEEIQHKVTRCNKDVENLKLAHNRISTHFIEWLFNEIKIGNIKL